MSASRAPRRNCPPSIMVTRCIAKYIARILLIVGFYSHVLCESWRRRHSSSYLVPPAGGHHDGRFRAPRDPQAALVVVAAARRVIDEE